MSSQLVVVGMHRSGTSGVTRLLNLAGAYFGPPGSATEPNEENPEGFWERRDVRAVCDGLLHAAGSDWWRLSGFDLEDIPPDARDRWLGAFEEVLADLDQHRPWVVKEPRLCVLLPVLRPLLAAPAAVHVVREPLEVAQSLRRRNGFPVHAGLALWELYTVHAFRATADLPRVLVRYADLVADPLATTARLVGDLAAAGVEGLHPPSDDEVLGFVRPDLHRHRREARGRRDRLNQHQAELAARIDDGSVLDPDGVEDVSAGALDALAELETSREVAERVARLTDEVGGVARDLGRAQDEVARRLDRLEGEVARRLDRLEGEAADREAELARRADDLARYRDVELARRRELGRLADEALGTLDRQLDRLDRSGLGRLSRRLLVARQVLTPGVARTDAGPLDPPRREIATRREEIQARARQEPAPGRGRAVPDPSDGPPPERSPAAAPEAAGPVGAAAGDAPLVRRTRPARPRSADRPRVAVVAWDVGHNPLGRANVLAEVLGRRFDVELWGAQFPRYGSDVWEPMRDVETPINVFPGRPFPEHLRTLGEVVGQLDADAVWVSKPRLPSYLLGAMAKRARNRGLVLDVDDHELSFFAEEEGLALAQLTGDRRPDDLELPFERSWTRACEPFIDAADVVTVSNVALQERHGGLLVPHARDERVFDPALHDREAVRDRLGVAPDQRLLLFGGTPRVHKGVGEVLRALEEIGDDRYRVLMFGTRELDELRGTVGDLVRWAHVLPPQPFSELPALVGAADLACVLQDPTHPVSRYQMPAKVSDALAMAVPCLVRATPPLAPLVAADVLEVLGPDEPLHERIAGILDRPGDAAARAARGRELFLREYSYEAVAEAVGPVFQRLIDDPPAPSPRLAELVDAPARAFAGAPGVPAVPAHPVRVPRRSRGAPPLPEGCTFDVVMFWRQNDSGLYGRRQDMVLEQLRRSPRVGTIVHFDNPISPESLLESYRSGRGRSDQRRSVATETVARVLHRRDAPGVHRHTFLFGARWSRRLGRPPRSAYVDHVRRVVEGHGLGGRPLVVWAYPANDDLPALIDALAPDAVVADVVDDNRSWYEPGSPHLDRLERNYAEVLGRADLVLANCDEVARSMQAFTDEPVHVVPNAAEAPDAGPPGPRPRALAGLTGPIISYVGNLSARLDVDLLEAVARARPGWDLVLVGSAHLDRSVLALDRLPNVHFPGVMRHTEVRRLLRHVDVALIPHVDDDMTRSMNPLKAYVYASAGVPTVATPVANLPDLGDLLTVAEGPEGFVAAIEDHLAAGRRPVDPELLRPHSWTLRMEQVIELLDVELARVPVARSEDRL